MLNQIGLGRNKLILNVEETKCYIGCNWGINVKGQSRMVTHLLLRSTYGNVIINYVNHHGEMLNQTNKTLICLVSDTRFICYKVSL